MGIKRYVGVDLAPAALNIANVDPDLASLRAGDLHTFTPEEGETFSAIVFNEVLHFSDDPAAAVARYVPFLAPGGVIAVSMYSPKRLESGANRLISRLWEATDGAEWDVLDDYRLTSDKKNVTWRLRLVNFRKRLPRVCRVRRRSEEGGTTAQRRAVRPGALRRAARAAGRRRRA